MVDERDLHSVVLTVLRRADVSDSVEVDYLVAS
jgi:hypothetical protein